MHLPLPRRVFLMTLPASGAALASGVRAQALVDEKDAQAAALGCVDDAGRGLVQRLGEEGVNALAGAER